MIIWIKEISKSLVEIFGSLNLEMSVITCKFLIVNSRNYAVIRIKE